MTSYHSIILERDKHCLQGTGFSLFELMCSFCFSVASHELHGLLNWGQLDCLFQRLFKLTAKNESSAWLGFWGSIDNRCSCHCTYQVLGTLSKFCLFVVVCVCPHILQSSFTGRILPLPQCRLYWRHDMENAFRATGPLWWESTVQQLVDLPVIRNTEAFIMTTL